MDIVALRKDFSVFVIESEATSAIAMTETLKNVGYVQARFYPTLASALAMIESEAPHLIVFDQDSFGTNGETFLVDIQGASPETKAILMSNSKRYLESLQLVSRGLAFDVIMRPLVSTLELVQKIDRACTALYLQYENEQLREQLADEKTGYLLPPIAGVTPTYGDSSVEAMHAALERLTRTKDLDQSVQIFIDALSQSLKNVPIAYFRYVPSHMSLLYSQSAWLPNEKFRGLGVDLKKEDSTQVQMLNDDPSGLQGLRTLVQQVFSVLRYTAFSHVIDDELIGVFVVLGDVDLANDVRASIFRRAFELAYKRNLTIKEKHSLESIDPLTGLINRKNFLQRIEQELARSRRLLMPVSIISMAIDGLNGLTQKIGQQQADAVIKTVAAILKRTTRMNDILARTGQDEFACLLPHTSHEGAAIKAERLRILLESTKVPLLEGLGLGPIRMSFGVSEYPSHCSDGDGLVQSADEALVQVRKAGGNKVCLAAAPRGFRMDFEPRSGADSSKFGIGAR